MTQKHPELWLLFAIPNGEYRNKATAARLKLEGVSPGVPDLCLPVARNGYHGFYIELKRQKGGRLSDSQKGWIQGLTQQGYKAMVCKGWEEAAAALTAYLELTEAER